MKSSDRSIVLTLLLLAGGAVNAAADPQDCIKISQPGERLACYDALFMPKQDAERMRQEIFGAEQMDRDNTGLSAPGITRIRSAVSEVTDHTRRRRGYKLANGQHWVQESARYLTIREGDEVTVTRGRLGGYTLSNDRGAATKVQRIE